MTSAGPQIIQETNITTEGGDGSLSACKSLVIYLRFHQYDNLLKFGRRRRLDDVLTTSHMRRTLARENFTSARRRRAMSMLKVPNNNLQFNFRHILFIQKRQIYSKTAKNVACLRTIRENFFKTLELI